MLIDYPRSGKSGIRRWIPSWRLILGLGFFAVLIGVVGLAFLVNRTSIPSPNEIAQANASVIYYSDGKSVVGTIGEFDRVQVELAQIPLTTQRAVLAAEDKDFYNHSGFSASGIARAFMNNLSGGAQQGGSTITQQYVKNAYLTSERSITRKLKELVLSIKLETSDSKDEILSNYLNTVYLGRGSYGLQAASRAYFTKDVDKLTVSESAVLAALLKSPEGFTPEDNLPRLTQRWNYVLDQMVEAGWLDAAERAATEFPLIKERAINRLGGPRGYIIASVKSALADLGYDEAELGVSGYSIVTTIDKRAQNAAVKAVRKEGPTSGTEGLRIGLAAIRPGTGEIVAMYGGADYVTQPLNNATQAIAQAGSTFKPFGLYAGLNSGHTLEEILPGKNGIKVSGYKVNNYSRKSFGDVTLLQATESSVNTAYVTLAYETGIDSVISAAIAAGIPEDTPGIEQNLTFVLGSASPRTIDVASAYATFAADGIFAKPYLIGKVMAPNGGVLYEYTPTPSNVLNTEAVRGVNYALQRVVTNGTGYAALGVGRPVAGKTGTTDENRSAWFAGYTPNLSAAVMMSKQDAAGNPISLSGTGGMSSVAGGSFPARIFTAFMRAALVDTEVLRFPKPQVIPTMTAAPSASATPTATDTPLPTDSATATDTAAPTESATP